MTMGRNRKRFRLAKSERRISTILPRWMALPSALACLGALVVSKYYGGVVWDAGVLSFYALKQASVSDYLSWQFVVLLALLSFLIATSFVMAKLFKDFLRIATSTFLGRPIMI